MGVTAGDKHKDLEITPPAKRMLDWHFEGTGEEVEETVRTIRIYLTRTGCSGAGLALARDEERDGDVLIETEGYRFIIERDLLDAAAPLTIGAASCGLTIGSALGLDKCRGKCARPDDPDDLPESTGE